MGDEGTSEQGSKSGGGRSRGAAVDDLLPLVYDELRRLARAYMARERSTHTLEATALVHEAYLRLLGPDGGEPPQWDGRAHFFAAAAEAMRRILIDRARRRAAVRHGGAVDHVNVADVPEEELPAIECPLAGVGDLLALDAALTRFAAVDADKADLVKLLCFAGLSLDEAAAVRGISRATAHRHWVYARAWLRSAVDGRGGGGGGGGGGSGKHA